jgi:two-component system sensor histidine kinase VicK
MFFNSIKWRFAIIYFILVFIALIIAGVFIMEAFETYYIDDVEGNLEDLTQLILPKVEDLETLEAENVQNILNTHKDLGFKEEIYVVNNEDRIIATTTENINKYGSSVLDFDLLVSAQNNNSETKVKVLNFANIRTMDKAVPINQNNDVSGVLYFRYNLDSIYENLSKSTMIIVRAIIFSTIFTLIMSYFIAKSISEPIEDIASKALKLSDGNFNQTVVVRSNDEIGELGRIFNLLTKQLRQSLNEVFKEKNKLEAIIENMNDGLIAIDIKGNIIHMNSQAKELLAIHHDVDTLSHIDQYFEFNQIINSDQWIGTKNLSVGNSILKVDYVPFEDDQKSKTGLLFVIRDVTEREKLDRMRKDFVANVSHELKTPLTSIKSYSETLLNGTTDDQTRNKFLYVINSEADRMTRLVKDLLQLSNFDSDKIKLNLEYDDYILLINNCILKLERTYEEKNQTVNLITSLDQAIAQFDYDRMEQVLINVISNAIKYTPEDGQIEIKLIDHDESYRIEVTDDGIGIPEEDIDHIFERFYRVSKARSRKLGGTGLGLSISKEIIESHQGSIAIDSQYNHGTKVVIEMPKQFHL